MTRHVSVTDTTEAERREHLKVLYESCQTGREFELFLKLLLSAMELEDVSVTRYSRDGGIDLTARRAGITGDRFDEVRYVVQAKRYAPGRTVPIESVRALRGVLTHTSRGMFITTGRFSEDAEKFVAEDPGRPIVLVDGLTLILNCIQLGVGFRFRPVLEPTWLVQQIGQLPAAEIPSGTQDGVRTFLKTITANDIRARIISLPWEIDDLLPGNPAKLSIEFPPSIPMKAYAYNVNRRYIAGVTEVLRHFGLLGPNDERFPRRAEWTVRPGGNITVRIGDRTPIEDAR